MPGWVSDWSFEIRSSPAAGVTSASAIQYKRVFSTVSAPFGLATSDSCSPLRHSHWRPPLTCPLRRLRDHAARLQEARFASRGRRDHSQQRKRHRSPTRVDSPQEHPRRCQREAGGSGDRAMRQRKHGAADTRPRRFRRRILAHLRRNAGYAGISLYTCVISHSTGIVNLFDLSTPHIDTIIAW